MNFDEIIPMSCRTTIGSPAWVTALQKSRHERYPVISGTASVLCIRQSMTAFFSFGGSAAKHAASHDTST